MAVQISIKTNAAQLRKEIARFREQLLPQAMADAVNTTAQRVLDAETRALEETFDKPSRFTLGAFTMSGFGGRRASVRSPVAVIVAKPAQAAYLAPSEEGTPQHLGQRRKIHSPVEIRTNAGGNIPKGKIAQLLARPDVFLGEINGVKGLWQRPRSARPRGTKRAKGGGLKANTTGRLKLLVAFQKPIKVKTHLHYRRRAEDIVRQHFASDFTAAYDRALSKLR